MAAQRWIEDMLRQRGVPFEVTHHSKAFTAQEVAHREHVSGHRLAKVVVAIADGKPMELVLPASRHVKIDAIIEALGAKKARLATEEELERTFTGCEVGAVPPLRHWKDVDVVMDTSLQVDGEIVFQAGTHEDVIRLKFSDWFDLVRPKVMSFAEAATVS